MTNKEVVERFFTEVYNDQNYEATHDYFAADYRDHGPDGARGPADAVEIFKRTHAAFPDLEVTIDDLIEEGGKVAFRGRFPGTHRGEFAGVTPNGATVDFEALEIFQVEDRKITDSWGYWPSSVILEQIRAS